MEGEEDLPRFEKNSHKDNDKTKLLGQWQQQ